MTSSTDSNSSTSSNDGYIAQIQPITEIISESKTEKEMPKRKIKYVYYDFETTGLGKSAWSDEHQKFVMVEPPEAVELAAKCEDDEFHTLVTPSCPISPRASYVHKIYRLPNGRVVRVQFSDRGVPIENEMRRVIAMSLTRVRNEIEGDIRRAIASGKAYRPDPYDRTFETHINEDGPLSYTESSTKTAGSVYERFVDWLHVHALDGSSLCLVAYNGERFDEPILRDAIRRYRLELPEGTTFHDPYPLVKKSLNLKRSRLVDAYDHLVGEPMPNAHAAMGDVRALVKVHASLMART